MALKNDFSYLKRLIETQEEILLDRDIILDVSEVELFIDGIEITKDNLTIDGCNHTIDARGKASIFNIITDKLTLKNITFKNGYGIENGSPINHDRGNLNIIDCEFISNSSNVNGGVLTCTHRSNIIISNSRFIENHSPKGGCIFNRNGKIELSNCEFIKNIAKIDASTIINMQMGKLTIKNCIFKSNNSENAGTILNFGRCMITNTIFERNSVEKEGGAINNHAMDFLRSRLTIKDSEFIENSSGHDGGGILNFSDADIDNVLFLRNYSKNQAGAISNQKKGSLTIENSKFIENKSDMTSGAIINWGKIDIAHSEFLGNSSKEFGGAIFNQESSFLKIKSTEFKNNTSTYSGGGITNWSKMQLIESSFENNSSKLGGAINCAKKATTRIEKTKFTRNTSSDGGAIFNNSHDTKISESVFKNHATNTVIRNHKSMTIFGSDFKGNVSENIIINDEDGFLSINGGKFNNTPAKSAIHNLGDMASLFQIKFESGKDITEICNESYMVINDLKFQSKNKTMINRGILDVKNISEESVGENIYNLNIINNLSKKSKNRFDFTYLQERIIKKEKFKNPNLKLKNDISLEFYETDYFEGGIEIRADNLTIDGDNHTIDGKNRSRIFIINAKNVCLKNITLKNGAFRNDHNEYILGGGAIHVLKNASLNLENMTFVENKSNTCGGALLNEGTVESINTKFIRNISATYGGAIYNKNEYDTNNDEFKGNEAKIAGAIYNQNVLKIKNDIHMDNNQSQFSEEIYNANVVNAEKRFENIIFNTSKINENKNKSESFTRLEEKIEKSNEIKLNQDIVFDYREDYYLQYVIQISKDLIIDGNGHKIEFKPLDEKSQVIDGNNSSSLFKIIKESTNVILKNIIFKNCYSNRQSIIENKGNLTIKNCRFINNHITESNSLIDNKHCLKITNSIFANNNSNNESLIKNSSKLEIDNSSFINNNSQAIGCCIRNTQEMTIEKSTFKSNSTKNKAGTIYNEYKSSLKIQHVEFEYNNADVDGGTIYNYGKLDISDSTFRNNTSQDEGGVINNRTSGEITITKTKFIKNKSKSNGGAIYNYGNIDIDLCEFKNNTAKYRSGAIEHIRALDNRKSNILSISNTQFVKNTSKDTEEIFTFDKANLKMKNCKFE